jgi:hypothetical protein
MVTNAFGSAMSSNALLTVGYVAPIIVSQPTNTIGIVGSTATFSIIVAGSLPMNYQWQSNGTNISGATNAFLTLANLQFSSGGNYDVAITNAYGSITSSNAYLNVVDIAEALNTTNLIWTTGGDVPWFVQANPAQGDLAGLGYSATHDGFASMQSGNYSPGQQSILQTTVVGPVTLTFWWQAVSLSNPDSLVFSVNGIVQSSISGISPWQIQTNYIGSGTNVLQWAYNETDSQTSARAAGWVDQVAVALGGKPPFITLTPSAQVVLVGSNATLSAAALGTPPLFYQWLLNGTNIDGATGTNLILANVQFTNEGNYTLVILLSQLHRRQMPLERKT